ncbi:integrase core domain-containing protein [Streptomyces sp. NPDC001226]
MVTESPTTGPGADGLITQLSHAVGPSQIRSGWGDCFQVLVRLKRPAFRRLDRPERAVFVLRHRPPLGWNAPSRSHSRPKTSNDTPYSEAHFKTTKYMSDYPERFDSLAHAREWFEAFIAYYNHEHRHSGIGWHTPASVHFGTAEEVRDQRAVTLAEAYARHPERFGRRPRPPRIPQQAWINDPAKRREPAPQTS